MEFFSRSATIGVDKPETAWKESARWSRVASDASWYLEGGKRDAATAGDVPDALNPLAQTMAALADDSGETSPMIDDMANQGGPRTHFGWYQGKEKA